ncbi:MAG: response regulator [Acidobacteriota bacterium]
MRNYYKLSIIALILLSAWTFFIYNIHSQALATDVETVKRFALVEARIAYEIDITYRRWAAQLGGVYVERSNAVQPNPYLEIPDRDVETSTGKRLTLVNPAYMTRMVHALMTDEAGLKGHITSLNPIRPENKPEPWEVQALQSFEAGAKEFHEVAVVGNEQVMRFMRPMNTGKHCLRCHAKQGYKEGDIRGGISVSVPMGRYQATLDQSGQDTQRRYALIYSAGCAFILTIVTILMRHEYSRNRIEAHLRDSERRIRESENMFRTLFERAPTGIMLLDGKGTITSSNSKLASIFGTTAEKYVGINIIDRTDDPDIKAYVAKLLESGEITFEHRHTSIITGTQKYLLAKGTRISKDIYVALIEDITKQKNTERELLAAKEQAEAYTKTKNEFLANMSHEIRTPLNGVLSILQLLETTHPTAEQQEYLGIATRSANRLTRLLTDILDISKIEAGKITLTQEVFVVSRLQDALQDLFSKAFSEKNITLRFAIDDTLPPRLIGDEARLSQILFNLVGNALKFTDHGSVSVEAMGLGPTVADNYQVLFIIRDTGIGISDELLVQIFEPFVQADSSYTRSFQGAGLGLSIVKKLVALLGGELAIDSAPGQGTAIYLSLPFTLPTEPADRTRQALLEIQPGPVETRILLAEDDLVSAIIGKLILEKSNYRVFPARNGQEALNLLHDHTVDLILMDIQMPDMDGIEATRRIRADPDPKIRHIPIIALTAHAMVGDRERFLAAGMNGHLTKPFSRDTLINKISMLLTSSQAADQPGPTGPGSGSAASKQPS